MTAPSSAPALHQQLQHTASLLMRVRGGASMPDALLKVPAQIGRAHV
jgi:hypothetical protein